MRLIASNKNHIVSVFGVKALAYRLSKTSSIAPNCNSKSATPVTNLEVLYDILRLFVFVVFPVILG